MDPQAQADHPAMTANPAHQDPTDKAVKLVAKDQLDHLVTLGPQAPLALQEARVTTANPAHPDPLAHLDQHPLPAKTAAQETQDHQDLQDHPEKMLNTALARLDPASELPRWPLGTLLDNTKHERFLLFLLLCSNVHNFFGSSKFA